jgi:hypothetical protein
LGILIIKRPLLVRISTFFRNKATTPISTGCFVANRPHFSAPPVFFTFSAAAAAGTADLRKSGLLLRKKQRGWQGGGAAYYNRECADSRDCPAIGVVRGQRNCDEALSGRDKPCSAQTGAAYTCPIAQPDDPR